jgi:hypothetical protein
LADETKAQHQAENIKLWQQLTSSTIPCANIEQAVYRDNIRIFTTNADRRYTDGQPCNEFYRYLSTTQDKEIQEFLLLAKQIEVAREEIDSPWYYPATPDAKVEVEVFATYVDACKAYTGKRLADRYALQCIRALFASHQFNECIVYYEQTLAHYPTTNLFRRMAEDYIAGCWSRIGDTDKANLYFAKCGDFKSLRCNHPTSYMIRHNPNSATLMTYLSNCIASRDKERILPLIQDVDLALASSKTIYRGDWYFLKAYIYGEYRNDYQRASIYIRRALQSKFSLNETADRARAYKTLIDAQLGNTKELACDMRWFETKIDALKDNGIEWNDMLQNICLQHWLPKLMANRDFIMAILLSGYAESYFISKGYDYRYTHPLDQMRSDPTCDNDVDYGSLTFQLMQSLSAKQLAQVQQSFSTVSPFQRHLMKYARTDNDYFNELIGTLYIREEKYTQAVYYLSRVSDKYQQMLNTYKYGILCKDPFVAYAIQQEESDDECYGNETNDLSLYCTRHWSSKRVASTYNVKYQFAWKMMMLRYQMKHDPSPNGRAMAKLEYAIGRFNSMEECWALTQYYRGWTLSRFDPTLHCDGSCKPLDFIYDYSSHRHETIAQFDRLKREALASFTTDEARAEAYLKLFDYRTLFRKYGHTAIGQRLQKRCDHWQDWL